MGLSVRNQVGVLLALVCVALALQGQSQGQAEAPTRTQAEVRAQAQAQALELKQLSLAASVDLGEVTVAYRITPRNRSVNAGLQVFARREDPAAQGQFELIAPTTADGKPLILHLFRDQEATGSFKVPLKKGSYGPVRLILFRSPDGKSLDYNQVLYDTARDPAAPRLALDVTVRTEQKRVVAPMLAPARVSLAEAAGGAAAVTVSTEVRLPASYKAEGGGFWVMAKGSGGFVQVWAGADQARPGGDPLDNYQSIPITLKLPPLREGLWNVELGLFRHNFGDPLQWVYPGVDFEVGGDRWVVRAPAGRIPPRLRVRNARFERLDGTPHNFYPDHPAALSGVKFVRGGNYGNAILWTLRPALNNPGYFTLLKDLGCRWMRFNFNPDRYLGEPVYQHAVDQVVENIWAAGLYPVVSPQNLPQGASRDEQAEKGLAVVRALAARYKGKSAWLQICNEPHEFKTWAEWKPVATRYVKAIREIDPEAFVVVPFEDFSKDGRGAAKDPIRDVRVDLYDGHAYVGPEQVSTLFGPAITAGLPVMLGEYGGGGPYLKQIHTALQSLSPAPLAVGPWAFTIAGQDSLPLIADGSTAELRFTEAGQAVASDFELWLGGKQRR